MDPFQRDPSQRAGFTLGQLLGGRADPDVGLDAEYKAYRNASALEQARDDVSRRVARDALPDAIDATPDLSPSQRLLLKATLGMASGQPNLSTAAQGLGDFLDLGTRSRREAALTGATPDVPLYNRLTALESDKPYQPVRVVGGNALPDGVGLADETFEMVPLPQTLARIEATEAQAERTRAATGNDARKADAAVDKSRRAPQSGGGKKAGSESAAILAQAREAIAAGANVKAVKKRLQDRGYGKLAREL